MSRPRLSASVLARRADRASQEAERRDAKRLEVLGNRISKAKRRHQRAEVRR